MLRAMKVIKNIFNNTMRSLKISDACKFQTQKISDVFSFGQKLIRNFCQLMYFVRFMRDKIKQFWLIYWIMQLFYSAWKHQWDFSTRYSFWVTHSLFRGKKFNNDFYSRQLDSSGYDYINPSKHWIDYRHELNIINVYVRNKTICVRF